MLFASSLAELALIWTYGDVLPFCHGSYFITYLSQGSMIKSLTMACVGIVVSTIGMDPSTISLGSLLGLWLCLMV